MPSVQWFSEAPGTEEDLASHASRHAASSPQQPPPLREKDPSDPRPVALLCRHRRSFRSRRVRQERVPRAQHRINGNLTLRRPWADSGLRRGPLLVLGVEAGSAFDELPWPGRHPRGFCLQICPRPEPASICAQERRISSAPGQRRYVAPLMPQGTRSPPERGQGPSLQAPRAGRSLPVSRKFL
jgi:hypothetical protein